MAFIAFMASELALVEESGGTKERAVLPVLQNNTPHLYLMPYT